MDQEASRPWGNIMQEFEFYFKCDGKPLQNFDQESDTI